MGIYCTDAYVNCMCLRAPGGPGGRCSTMLGCRCAITPTGSADHRRRPPVHPRGVGGAGNIGRSLTYHGRVRSERHVGEFGPPSKQQ
jgi:hypothetical protein